MMAHLGSSGGSCAQTLLSSLGCKLIEFVGEAEGRDVSFWVQPEPVGIVVSALTGEGIDTRSKGKGGIQGGEVRVAVLDSHQPVPEDAPFNSSDSGPAGTDRRLRNELRD